MKTTIKDIGGKAYNLHRLKEMGCKVPRFISIPHQEVQDLMLRPDLLDQKIYDYFGEEELRFAVRSSAAAEDGGQDSYAGIFESKLMVDRADIHSTIRELAERAKDDRVNTYKTSKGNKDDVQLSFIIQEMVLASYSGVAFSAHPVHGEEFSVIHVTEGLGDKLVAGQVDGQEIEIDNTTGDILKNDSALNVNQILAIQDTLKAIEKNFGHPVDIEFAIEGATLYLLQARPITTLAKKRGKKIVWDNSNIIESYPGITLPLTFSFIKHMYEVVYLQFSGLLGASKTILEEKKSVFSNMLGHLNGRVYYNLRSWYQVLSLLPGYHLNAGFMEKMMGVKESFKLEKQHSLSRSKASILVFKCLLKLLYAFITLRRRTKRFMVFSNQTIDTYKGQNYSEMSSYELMESYQQFEEVLSKKWDAPLINDFFAMITFGLLESRLKKVDPKSTFSINDLLVGSNDIISVKPMQSALEIAKQISKKDAYRDLFQLDAQEILNRLDEKAYEGLKNVIDQYIQEYGERCPEELKLETRTYVQDPVKFIQLIQSYQGLCENKKNTPKAGRQNLDFIEKLDCSIGQKILLKKLIKHTRYLVSNRENLRFQRTRAYGVVRRIFDALGHQFHEQNLIGAPLDIYYLNKEEVFDFIQGTSSDTDLKSLIKRRKNLYKRYKDQSLPNRIITFDTVNTNDLTRSNIEVSKDDLRGIGCCAGIVKAPIRIVTDPSTVDDLQKAILVAEYTDPGWVRLFPSISGIIVERGSLLSHSAIVARELGIPCIVGVEGATHLLKNGDSIIMDGSTGNIEVLTSLHQAA